LNINAKISPEKFLSIPKNRKKKEIISLNYDVNDHVYLSQNLSTVILCGFSRIFIYTVVKRI